MLSKNISLNRDDDTPFLNSVSWYRHKVAPTITFQIEVKDTSATKSDGQSNEKYALVACKESEKQLAADAKDSKEIICDDRLAATEVIITFTGSSPQDLAEVVVVGKTWGAFCLFRSEIMTELLFNCYSFAQILIILQRYNKLHSIPLCFNALNETKAII